MKSFIDNNVMEIADLEVSAEGKISEILVVKKVRPSYMKDAEGKITKNIENIKYDCVDPETFASVTLKVQSTRPIVTNEMIEASESVIYIKVPVSETIIRPYEINFGKAKVTVIVPYVNMEEK